MAVPMVWIEDADPERRYPCPGCGGHVALTDFRLLYRGTRRPLRCLACEIRDAPDTRARIYLSNMEQERQSRAVYAAAHRDTRLAYGQQWRDAHRDDQREWKRAYWRLNSHIVGTQNMARYEAHKDEILAAGARRYAATHGTPEAVAIRRRARQDREIRTRARLRRQVRRLVATEYSVPDPEVLRDPLAAADPDTKAARQAAIYISAHLWRHARDRHPEPEIAEEYGLTLKRVRIIVTKMARRVRYGWRDDPEARTVRALRDRIREQLRNRRQVRLLARRRVSGHSGGRPLAALAPTAQSAVLDQSPRARYERLAARRREEMFA